MKQWNQEEQPRFLYLDCLRILASLAVIMIHIQGAHWYTTEITTVEWHTMNLFDSMVRWAAPLFAMISGALFLSKSQRIQKILGKNVIRILTAFLFWSLFYAVVKYSSDQLSFWEFVKEVAMGSYHMWFLYMIASMYLLTPILQKVTESDQLTRYFMVLSILFGSLLPTLISCVRLRYEGLAEIAQGAANQLDLGMVGGFSLYYVGGYYFHKTELSNKKRKILYVLAIASLIFTVAGTAGITMWKGIATELFYLPMSPNVICMSAGVFVFGKYHFQGVEFSKKTTAWLRKLSKYNFGAYLVHVFVMLLLQFKWGLHALTFHPIISTPIVLLVTAVVSYAISAVLNSIPGVNKYLV